MGKSCGKGPFRIQNHGQPVLTNGKRAKSPYYYISPVEKPESSANYSNIQTQSKQRTLIDDSR